MKALTHLTAKPAQSATDLVFDTLYNAVVQLELPPGSRVSEADIAERLQVSRQPVRDAFFRLSNRGFVLIRPQRATLITKISEAEVLRTAFIRIALETACIKEAINKVSDSDISQMRSIIEAQRRAVNKQDRAAFHELDETFHAAICEIGEQPRVWNLIQEQKGHMDRARFLSLSFNQEAALAEHEQILDALVSGDEEAAVARLEAHLSKIRGYLHQIRLAHSHYFEEVD